MGVQSILGRQGGGGTPNLFYGFRRAFLEWLLSKGFKKKLQEKKIKKKKKKKLPKRCEIKIKTQP